MARSSRYFDNECKYNYLVPLFVDGGNMQDSILSGLEFIKGKNILLLVSGSIAAYKTPDLGNTFKKLGANVRVVMSEEAKKFVTPLCFEAILHTKVLHADTESWIETKDELSCNHIAYAKWADIAIVAPASANTLAKIAWGIADNLVLSTLLACKAPKMVAPAMNTAMFESPQTRHCLKYLKDYGFGIIEPRVGLLACDTYGKGAMSEIEEIIFEACKRLASNDFWQDKEVIITGGGSVENIDSVRYLSNHSSGLQASFLAIALYLLGAKVVLIASSFPIILPLGVKRFEVTDSASYLKTIKENIPQKERVFLFMAGAISDYVPKKRFESKLKKENIGENWNIECVKNIDILKELCFPNLIKIGFKAECDEARAIQSAQKMLQDIHDGGKGCKVVCLNIIGKHNPFGSSNNEMMFFSKTATHHATLKDKLSISFEITDFVQRLLC